SPGEQEPADRRLAAAPAGRPPNRRLMAGAGERDVGEPEVLTPALELVLALMVAVGRSFETDIDRAATVLVVEVDRERALRVWSRVPQEGAIDDRKLEALAAVNREDLDGVGVG